jgi:Fe(3+) dicitrate transport protein
LGNLSLVGNLSLLSAEFEGGPLKGREPAYAPNYLLRIGSVYRWRDQVKLSLLGTLVEDHFWADDNAAGSTGTTGIPSYAVWDLTGEVWVWKEHAKLVAGINNVFNEAYFSRVRSDGIEPALRRQYYLGCSLVF